MWRIAWRKCLLILECKGLLYLVKYGYITVYLHFKLFVCTLNSYQVKSYDVMAFVTIKLAWIISFPICIARKLNLFLVAYSFTSQIYQNENGSSHRKFEVHISAFGIKKKRKDIENSVSFIWEVHMKTTIQTCIKWSPTRGGGVSA